jgi:glycine/D-amino acid oxidase-like deaminating enzyme
VRHANATDVLVVGGGIVGCALGWMLAREGVEVTVIERRAIGAGASGANAGSLHAQIPHEPFLGKGEGWARNYGSALRLLAASIALWRDWPEALATDLDLAVPGGLLVAETAAQMADIARKAAIERDAGVAVELLDEAGIRRLAPYVSSRVIGGLFCPAEGKANPLAATPALARAAIAAGARLLAPARLDRLRRGADGFQVETDAGSIVARRVVNAAGAEAARVSAMLGLDLPIEAHPIQVNVTEPAAPIIRHLVYHAVERLSLKQARNGGVLIGGGWPSRRRADGRLVPDPRSMSENIAVAIAAVPAIAELRLLRTWPAIVNGTDDWLPILGETPGVPGFFHAIFPWMGFTGGPITARITADLLLGRDAGFDLAPFRADRFAAFA